MNRVNEFLFGVVLVILVLFFAFTMPSQADTGKATQALRQTVVQVNGTSCTGSGSVVEGKSGKHYVLTNYHVCLCASYQGRLYSTFEGGELVQGKVVKRDSTVDLCAVRVEDTRPALKLGDQLLPFTEVNTRGYPGGRLTESHGQSGGNVEWDADFDISEIGVCPEEASKGYGLNGVIQECRLHFTSTLTNLYGRPGASGSPVVNDNGELVGVVSSWHPGNEYETGMVPFSDVRRFLSAL